MSEEQTRVIFLDCETTGLNPMRDEIISVYALAVEFPSVTEVGEFSCKYAPIGPVSEGAARVNGYDPKTWGGVQMRDNTIRKLWSLVGDNIIAGWNTQFDIRFLQQAFNRIRLEWTPNYNVIDVKSMYADEKLKDPSLSMSLAATAERHGVEHNPHDAQSDTEATVNLFLKKSGFLFL